MSAEYRNELRELGIAPSASRRGNCYHNAVVESFFSTLKLELVHVTSFNSIEHARWALVDYMENFYNSVRLHSSLGYAAPMDHELAFNPAA